MNRKSIQILRGSETYNPRISDEVLADGQPFYSKMTKSLYIGDGVAKLRELEGTQIGADVTVSDTKAKIQFKDANGDKQNVTMDMLDAPHFTTDYLDEIPFVLGKDRSGQAGWVKMHWIIPVLLSATKKIQISAGSDFDQLPPITRDVSYPLITGEIFDHIRLASMTGVLVSLRYAEDGEYYDWQVSYTQTGNSSDSYELTLLSGQNVFRFINQHDEPEIYPLLNAEQLQTKADIYPHLPPSGAAMVQVRDNYFGDNKIRHLDITVAPRQWAIARRDEAGNIRVTTPTDAEDAINKQYFEDNLNQAIEDLTTPVVPPVIRQEGTSSELSQGVKVNDLYVNKSDALITYATSGNICFVNYAFTAKAKIPASARFIASGLPKAKVKQFFSCMSTFRDPSSTPQVTYYVGTPITNDNFTIQENAGQHTYSITGKTECNPDTSSNTGLVFKETVQGLKSLSHTVILPNIGVAGTKYYPELIFRDSSTGKYISTQYCVWDGLLILKIIGSNGTNITLGNISNTKFDSNITNNVFEAKCEYIFNGNYLIIKINGEEFYNKDISDIYTKANVKNIDKICCGLRTAGGAIPDWSFSDTCFEVPYVASADSKEPDLVNFVVQPNGEIRTHYGHDFPADHFVKGGFTYIIADKT